MSVASPLPSVTKTPTSSINRTTTLASIIKEGRRHDLPPSTRVKKRIKSVVIDDQPETMIRSEASLGDTAEEKGRYADEIISTTSSKRTVSSLQTQRKLRTAGSSESFPIHLLQGMGKNSPMPSIKERSKTMLDLSSASNKEREETEIFQNFLDYLKQPASESEDEAPPPVAAKERISWRSKPERSLTSKVKGRKNPIKTQFPPPSANDSDSEEDKSVKPKEDLKAQQDIYIKPDEDIKEEKSSELPEEKTLQQESEEAQQQVEEESNETKPPTENKGHEPISANDEESKEPQPIDGEEKDEPPLKEKPKKSMAMRLSEKRIASLYGTSLSKQPVQSKSGNGEGEEKQLEDENVAHDGAIEEDATTPKQENTKGKDKKQVKKKKTVGTKKKSKSKGRSSINKVAPGAEKQTGPGEEGLQQQGDGDNQQPSNGENQVETQSLLDDPNNSNKHSDLEDETGGNNTLASPQTNDVSVDENDKSSETENNNEDKLQSDTDNSPKATEIKPQDDPDTHDDHIALVANANSPEQGDDQDQQINADNDVTTNSESGTETDKNPGDETSDNIQGEGDLKLPGTPGGESSEEHKKDDNVNEHLDTDEQNEGQTKDGSHVNSVGQDRVEKQMPRDDSSQETESLKNPPDNIQIDGNPEPDGDERKKHEHDDHVSKDVNSNVESTVEKQTARDNPADVERGVEEGKSGDGGQGNHVHEDEQDRGSDEDTNNENVDNERLVAPVHQQDDDGEAPPSSQDDSDAKTNNDLKTHTSEIVDIDERHEEAAPVGAGVEPAPLTKNGVEEEQTETEVLSTGAAENLPATEGSEELQQNEDLKAPSSQVHENVAAEETDPDAKETSEPEEERVRTPDQRHEEVEDHKDPPSKESNKRSTEDEDDVTSDHSVEETREESVKIDIRKNIPRKAKKGNVKSSPYLVQQGATTPRQSVTQAKLGTEDEGLIPQQKTEQVLCKECKAMRSPADNCRQVHKHTDQADDADSGRGTSCKTGRDSECSTGSAAVQTHVTRVKVSPRRVTRSTSSLLKDKQRWHYSLIDSPYMKLPLRDIANKAMRKELAEKRRKLYSSGKDLEPVYCPMCANYTTDYDHVIRATLRYNRVSNMKTGNKNRSRYFSVNVNQSAVF